MLDYWMFILIPVIFSLIHRKDTKKSQWSLFFVALVYIFFTGFRDEVGPDWFAYQFKYDYLSRTSYLEGMVYSEPGFAILNWLVGKIEGSVYLVNGVIATILVTGTVRLAKLMPFPWLALISVTPYLIIVIGMSAARQAAAIGIVFHLIAIWVQGAGLLKKILYALLAISFHYSAVLALLFVVQSIRMPQLYRLVLLIVGGGMSFPVLMATKKAEYYEHTYLSNNMISSGALMHASLNAIPAIIYFIFYRKFKKIFVLNDLVFLFAVLSIVSIFGVSVSSTGVDRLSLYLSPIQMMIYATLPLIFINKTTQKEVYLFIIFVQIMIMVVWFNFAGHAHGYLPYKNIFY